MSGSGRLGRDEVLAELTRELRELSAQVSELAEQSRLQFDFIQAAHHVTMRALELIHDDDPGARRRLYELRAETSYEQAFTASDPLVSVVIPTWDRARELVERSVPSALSQTHSNIEVIIVGDAASPELAAAVESIRDPRVSFRNLTVRGPYEENPLTAWRAYGTSGMNAGVQAARGAWIAPLGDDDAFAPDHVESLLAAARERRLEFVYGRLRMIRPDGSESLLGEFPPRFTQVGLQAALYHSGLRFLELELGHALFNKPNDWGLVHRMMRTGVRMGMIDALTVDYWASAAGLGEQ